jgi:hypothetical protein
MTRHALALFLLGALAAPSPAQTQQHLINGRARRVVEVSVSDALGGGPLDGFACSVAGVSATETTDQDGSARFEFWAPEDKSVFSVLANKPGYSVGYGDLVVPPFGAASLTISVTAEPLQLSPLLLASSGGSASFSGVLSPYPGSTATESYSVSINIPAGALPADGYIGFTPSPSWSTRSSGPHNAFYSMARFELNFFDSRHSLVENPTFTAPLTLETDLWHLLPGSQAGGWPDCPNDLFGISRLNHTTNALEPVGESIFVDEQNGLATFLLSSFSSYAVTENLSSLPDDIDTHAWRLKMLWTLITMDWGDWPSGGPTPTNDPPPPPHGVEDGPTDGLLSWEDDCEAAGGLSVVCGEIGSEGDEMSAGCTAGTSTTISAGVMAALSASAGVDTGKLASLIAKGSGSVGAKAEINADGSVTTTSGENYSGTIAGGGFISSQATARCYSGTKYIMKAVKILNVAGIEAPLRVCMGFYYKLDVTFDAGCSMESGVPCDDCPNCQPSFGVPGPCG